MQSVLEIDSVTKHFGNRPVLTDVFLKCYTSDIIGLFGRNGSGKSTFLKILFGTLNCENKFIRINEKKFNKPFMTSGLINYLPQDNFLLPELSLKKCVDLFIDEPTDSFFEDEILSRFKDGKVNSLSGGELRYLELKLILNNKAKFVLLDEPFNGVDPITINYLIDLIKAHSKNQGIILTDHDYNTVLDVGNRFCLIHEGELKSINGRADLIEWDYLTINSIKN
jgi:lipopolysaccharide export system ATP-binding protein